MHRLTLVAWVGAISLLGGTLSYLGAQTTPSTGNSASQMDSRLLRPRSALQTGIELYMKADYEQAESFLRTAEQGKQQLTPTEQARLDDYLTKNLEALKGRMEAQENLQTVEQLLKEGHSQEAEPYIKSLRTNKFLTAVERQRVNGFSEQAKKTAPINRPMAPVAEKTVQAAPPAAAVPAKDADTLFAEARKAFDAKNYDVAENLAHDADKAGYKAGMLPWSDSPAKLIKEIHAARAKVVGSDNKVVAVDANDKKATGARDLLKQAHVAVQAGDLVTAKKLVKDAEDQKANIPWYEPHTVDKVKNEIARAEQVAAPTGIQQASATVPAATPSAATKTTVAAPVTEQTSSPTEARMLVKEARRLYEEQKLDEAEDKAKRARLVTVKWGLFEDNPDKVLADVIKAKESHNGEKASALLSEARKKMEQNQFDEAEKLTYQAEALRPTYPIWYRGERHDRLRAEIAVKKKGFVKPELPPLLDTVVKKDEKKATITPVEASTPMPSVATNAGPMRPTLPPPPAADTGKSMASTAGTNAGPTRPTMPPSAAQPTQLPAKPTNVNPPVTVADARPSMPTPPPASPYAAPQRPTMPPPEMPAADPRHQEALKLLAEARADLNKGDYRPALDLAAKVKTMGFVPAQGEESPEAIVQAVLLAQRKAAANEAAVATDAAKNRATQCLAAARLLQREGRLLEAMQAVHDARNCHATFAANDETPDVVLADLKVAAQKQCDTYLAAAQTLADAMAYDKSKQYLSYVKQLGTTYQLDVTVVDQKFTQVAQMSKTKPEATVTSVAATATEGDQLVEQVRVEMERGDLVKARKLAESLYVGAYGMKAQARDLLAKIDDAEYQQSVKRSQTLYDQGVRAFNRKDYAVAASYFQGIDLRLLDERKRSHAQEIMNSRELQPSTIVQASKVDDDDAKAPGKATASDQPHKVDDKAGLLAEVQQRQAIEYQRLREQQLQAQREANRLSKQGDMNAAIQVVESALSAIKSSNLDADQMSPMQRQLQERLRQYNVQKEQMAYAELQKNKMDANSQVASQKYKFEEKKKEMVADYMRQYNAFMRDGKYKEAAAVAMKAKEVDPDDPVADAAIYKAEVTKSLNRETENLAGRNSGVAQSMQDLVASATPTVTNGHEVDYPKDWEGKTRTRRGRTSLRAKPETPDDVEMRKKLDKYISVDFKNKPLSEVLDEFRAMTNVNLSLDTANINLDGIGLESPITEQLPNAKASTVLSLILGKARLTYVINDGVVVVTTPLGKRGKEVRVVYPVADLVTPREVAGGNAANKLLAQPTSGLFGDVATAPSMAWTVQSPGGGDGYVPGGPQPGKTPRQAGQSTQDLLMRLIIDTIEPGSWDNLGGSGHVDYYPLGMSLVVNQTPDIQEQVNQLLERLRELQDVQVTVECRFITLTENFYERIGVDFDLNINTNQTKFGRQVVTGAFAPQDQPNAPSHINAVVGMTPSGNFTTDLDVPIRNTSFELSQLPTGFGGFPGQASGNGGIDMGIAFLSSIETFLFIEAAQGDIRNNVLTAPKLTLFNGQQANINSSVTELFVLNVNAIRDPLTGLVTFVPQTTPLPSSIDLTLTAVVSADRRYVKLNLVPFITRVVDSGKTFSPVAGVTLQQPSFESLSVSTSVSVPDGGTILIGGLKRMTEQRREFGPPILSKIPYVNRLFRNQSFGREANNIIIMVTPRIIIAEEEEERLGSTFAF